jgi:hypothetical protein
LILFKIGVIIQLDIGNNMFRRLIKLSQNYSIEQPDNNAYEVFIEDTKEKGLIARSSRMRVTKNTYLSPSKLKKLNGVVNVSSLYDTIMSYEEFQGLSKSEKLKTLEGYEQNGKTRQQVAEAWGKKVQSIHDLTYRLKRDPDSKNSSKTNTRGQTKNQTKEVPSVSVVQLPAEHIHPCSIKMIRSMDGNKIKEWILKIIDLVEGEHISVNLDIKKQSKSNPSKFAFSVQLIDEYTTDELLSEVTNIAGMLGNGKYQVSFELNEIHSSDSSNHR